MSVTQSGQVLESGQGLADCNSFDRGQFAMVSMGFSMRIGPLNKNKYKYNIIYCIVLYSTTVRDL